MARPKKRPNHAARHEVVHVYQYNLDVVGDDARRAVQIARKLRAGIEAAADICRINPPVCVGNLGIPRAKMPQIEGDRNVIELAAGDRKSQAVARAIIAAGGKADNARTTLAQFLDRLERAGVTTRRNRVPVGTLKATQREIQAAKVYQMADGHLKGLFPTIDKQIIVSKDGHILDGHHRWAAILTIDPKRYMDVLEVGLPMDALLREAAATPGVYRADFSGAPLGDAVQKTYKRAHRSRLSKTGARAPTSRVGVQAYARGARP